MPLSAKIGRLREPPQAMADSFHECNHSPLSRHHHRCKQAEGWHLEQNTPGITHWTTPTGRHYTTTPTTYSGWRGVADHYLGAEQR